MGDSTQHMPIFLPIFSRNNVIVVLCEGERRDLTRMCANIQVYDHWVETGAGYEQAHNASL